MKTLSVGTVTVVALLACTAMAGGEIDPRTQCKKIMKGATESDRSYQPMYGPCCKDRKAMASKAAMEKCIGQRGLEELRKQGVPMADSSSEEDRKAAQLLRELNQDIENYMNGETESERVERHRREDPANGW